MNEIKEETDSSNKEKFIVQEKYYTPVLQNRTNKHQHWSNRWKILVFALTFAFACLFMQTFVGVQKALAEASVPIEVVQKFAPELRFDRAAKGYPMSAQPYYEALEKYNATKSWNLVQNTNRDTLSSDSIPTYFKARNLGNQVRITYWWFYGYQEPCFEPTGEGSHNGDWEHITVLLTQDRSAVAAVTYYQHGGHYTRIIGPRDAPCTPGEVGRCTNPRGFSLNGTHPIVYVGKLAHGSYHDGSDSGLGAVPGAKCAYYADYRNPASEADYLRTWRILMDLDGNAQRWMAGDRIGGDWQWGPNGPNTHPTRVEPSPTDLACDGNPADPFGKTAGCFKSECLAGDDETALTCLKECGKGYTNMGLTCYKAPFSSYKRSTHAYGYTYKLPTMDAGLSRRRNNQSEWSLP